MPLLWILFNCLLFLFFRAHSAAVLLNSQSPKYYGEAELLNVNLNREHFTKNRWHPGTKGIIIPVEDVHFCVFDCLDDFRILGKCMFQSKSLFRLLSRYLILRFQRFNYSLFLTIPMQYRLVFALRHLTLFEKHFPALKGGCRIAPADVYSLILLIFHLESPFYISPRFIKYIISAYSPFKHKDLSSCTFPVDSVSTMRNTILSLFICNRAFYAIEAICWLDRTLILLALESVICKMASEDGNAFIISFAIKIEQLLKRLVDLSADPVERKEFIRAILLNAIKYNTMWIFSLILPLWEDPIDSLDTEDTYDHLLLKLSRSGKCCKKILDRPEIPSDIIVMALKLCLARSNWEMATCIIRRYSPVLFLDLFDMEIIFSIKQILEFDDEEAREEIIDINTINISPINVSRLLMALASFGFRQRRVLILFRELISTVDISERFIIALSSKFNQDYYEIAKYEWFRQQENTIFASRRCTIS